MKINNIQPKLEPFSTLEVTWKYLEILFEIL